MVKTSIIIIIIIIHRASLAEISTVPHNTKLHWSLKYENEPLLYYIMSQYGDASNMLNTSSKNEDILRNIY